MSTDRRSFSWWELFVSGVPIGWLGITVTIITRLWILPRVMLVWWVIMIFIAIVTSGGRWIMPPISVVMVWIPVGIIRVIVRWTSRHAIFILTWCASVQWRITAPMVRVVTTISGPMVPITVASVHWMIRIVRIVIPRPTFRTWMVPNVIRVRIMFTKSTRRCSVPFSRTTIIRISVYVMIRRVVMIVVVVAVIVARVMVTMWLFSSFVSVLYMSWSKLRGRSSRLHARCNRCRWWWLSRLELLRLNHWLVGLRR